MIARTLCLLALLVPTVSGAQATGESTGTRTDEILFVSHGDRLSGSLVLPRQQPIRAALVFVHGSGKQTRNLALAERFANAGIAALVYDKRGAGKSGGVY